MSSQNTTFEASFLDAARELQAAATAHGIDASDLAGRLDWLAEKLAHDPAGVDMAYATANLVAAQLRDELAAIGAIADVSIPLERHLTADFLDDTPAVNDEDDELSVYVYKFAPDDEGEIDPRPYIFAGVPFGRSLDFNDSMSAIRFGLAVAHAGIRAAELAKQSLAPIAPLDELQTVVAQ